MRVLLTGAGGQLGRVVQQCQPAGIELLAPARDQLDITHGEQLKHWVVERTPELVINCAAYTQVDKAESEPQLAEAANHIAVQQLAEFAGQVCARVLHVSTDYVFDGQANKPYPVTAPCAPQGVYGASKRKGEQALLKRLPEQSSVIRTSWLYASDGQNFLRTMLGLLASRATLSVVVDQLGSPTHCGGLAWFIWWLAGQRSTPPLLHWADAGVASWYDFATAIGEEAAALGLLSDPAQVQPISSRDYPQVAPRPPYSVLDTSASYQLADQAPVHWREGLRRTLIDYQQNSQTV
ncbi:MAG: dTDP-4-dehydrorhamnose reductase [Gammaproteobacteria bacterium]